MGETMSKQAIEKYIHAYPGEDNSVMYETQNCQKIFRWKNGSRSWRNNNPGNIRNGSFTNKHGAIGQAGGFACFPDKETGKQAIISLLKTKIYQSLSIEKAIHRYAPTIENDTNSYLKHILTKLELTSDTPMNTLSDFQIECLANVIEKHEGYFEGLIEEVKKDEKYIWRTQKDERVRPQHQEREGKVFSWYLKPINGHPGEATNCRCKAEKYNISNREYSEMDFNEVKSIISTKEYKNNIQLQKSIEKWFKMTYS